MKTPLLPHRSSCNLQRRSRHRAFSLVEVTLALGIITFGLVGVVGVLPTALSSGRQSFDQNRAAAIANTIFASIRSQPFDKVCYVDEQFDSNNGTALSGAGPNPIDLNQPQAATFYAKFLNAATDQDTSNAFGTQRRLSFSASPPTGGADYQVAFDFSDRTAADGTPIPANKPDGMLVTGQACRIELVISPVSRANSAFHFVSTVANRANH